MPPRIGPKKPIQFFLAEWREANDPPLSQEQLGLRITPPVDKGTVSRWEGKARAGSLTTDVVAAYAEALDKSFEDMLRHPDAPRPLDSVAEEMGVGREAAITALKIVASRKAS